MKKITFLLALTIIPLFALNAKNLNEELITIKDFNFIELIDTCGEFETFYDENSKTHIFAIPVLNSDDKLMAYSKSINDELTPLFFVNESYGKLILKDVNNYRTTLDIRTNSEGDMLDLKYFSENDSKVGFAIGCMGGSTVGCIELAITSCAQDPMCALMCGLASWRCIGAITAACALHCNIQ
jgi:hypothetical protein